MYDSRCEDLAAHFLGEESPADALRSLAQTIQDCVEEWLSAQEDAPAGYVPASEVQRAREEGMREAARIARNVGRPVGAGDGDTYIPGTSADAEAAILRTLATPQPGGRHE